MGYFSIMRLLVVGSISVVVVGGIAAVVYFLVKGSSDRER